MRSANKEPFSSSEHCSDLAARIGAAKSAVMIFSGELHRDLFTNPEVLDSLKSASRRGVKIRILTSPALSSWARAGAKWNPVLELARQDVLELRWRSKRGSHAHFSAFDGMNVVVEEAHEPLQSFETRKRMVLDSKNSALKVDELIRPFNEMWESACDSTKSAPVLLTNEEIVAISEMAKGKNRVYSDLEKEEILSLLSAKEVRDSKANGVVLQVLASLS